MAIETFFKLGYEHLRESTQLYCLDIRKAINKRDFAKAQEIADKAEFDLEYSDMGGVAGGASLKEFYDLIKYERKLMEMLR